MIAPLRTPEAPSREDCGHLREARRLVAATLLEDKPASHGPAIPAWQAWLFVAWLVVTTVAFGLSALGWIGR
ncbi:MAG: hypothetical protein JW809_01150 [Pirellulales bacterium]|nr:hypothetical protein [Pirellulales bacterium]